MSLFRLISLLSSFGATLTFRHYTLFVLRHYLILAVGIGVRACESAESVKAMVARSAQR